MFVFTLTECGSHYDLQTRGFVTQRHSELEAEVLSMVCKDIEVDQVLQDITGKELIK